MANWDVIVLGLGGVGSAAAYQLAKSGYQVLGLDQFEPVHDRGSSHGQTRVIRQAYFEHPCYVPLLKRAYQLWDELDECSESVLFRRTGLVEIGPADGVVIPGVLASAKLHDLEIEQLSIDEVCRRLPGIRGEGNWQAVVETNAGYLRVEDCVATHLQAAHRAGASCRHHQRVIGWTTEGSGVTVELTSGKESAERLVIAAGPWSKHLLPASIGYHLRILRKHLYWVPTEDRGYADQAGFPCFFFETDSGYYYGFPAVDSQGVKVARHSGGQLIEEPAEDHGFDQADWELTQAFLRRHLPGVSGRIGKHVGCYYTVTPDEHFVIDSCGNESQIVVIAGLSGHGFKFTSVLGEIAAQLCCGHSTYDLSLFSASRLLG